MPKEPIHDSFQALTSDTDKLLHRLPSAPLLENHVLTVLADIRRKRLSGYGSSFAEAQGTDRQTFYVRKLERDITRWTERLDAYLQTAFIRGNTDSPAVQVARRLRDALDDAIRTETGNGLHYYRMVHTVTAIQEKAGDYLQQAADSGDTEPSLALFIAYLKNYAGIAGDFNGRFASLPELYRKDVLHAQPAEAVPDNAYLTVTPTLSDSGITVKGGFTLEKGTAFAAGEDLTYRTVKDEYISPMRCTSVQAAYLDESGLYLQTLDLEDTDTTAVPFTGGERLQTGLLIESPMLVLEEGRREVTVCFRLKGECTPHDTGKQQGFILQYATEKGWTTAETECGLSADGLRFGFTIEEDGAATSPCTEKTHGTTTRYPALRILSAKEGYPTWAQDIDTENVRIEVGVDGIRNFTLTNELGDTNTAQSVSPFGIQAEQGSWFLTGCREAAMKPLKGMTLTGKWQKLPETKDRLERIYKDYPGVDASSFRIGTAFRKNGKWIPLGKDLPLFGFDSTGKMQDARIDFCPTDSRDGAPDEWNGLFRVTLDSPDIGFGADAYRHRFTEVMIHNSRCKKKDMWDVPQEPPMPRLADVELEYKAELQASMPASREELRITPVLLACGDVTPPQEETGRLLPQFPSPYMLYFAFTGAAGGQKIRMYLDLTADKALLPGGNFRPDGNPVLAWSCWNGMAWTDIPDKDITAEETVALTRSGFIEITLEEKIQKAWTDKQGLLWIRATFMQDGTSHRPVKSRPDCLAVRGVWTNCICVTAEGGDGTPLPAGTIQGTAEEDARIESVAQPLPGSGGRQAETDAQCAARQTARMHNRHRAVTMQDYGDILTEHFPEADKVQCFNVTQEDGTRKTFITVFSRAEDKRYFLSPTWKLAEMERTVRQYASPFARIEVINPIYESVDVRIKVRLHKGVEDEGRVVRQLTILVQDYLAPWQRNGEIPEPGRTCPIQGLRSRLANHENVEDLLELTVSTEAGTQTATAGKDDKEGRICGRYPWSILLPKTEIELLPYLSGIEEAEIEGNFTIN